MIGLLIALHPKQWRNEYGDEYRALLEGSPLTVAIVFDVVRNAFRLHVAARPTLTPILTAIAVCSIGETIAGKGQLSDNILWIPSSPVKALLLAAVVMPWILAFTTIRRARRERHSAECLADRDA